MRTNKKNLKKPNRLPETGAASGPRTSRIIRIRDSFTALTAIVSFVAGTLGILVLYANNKGAFANLKDDFYSWLYQDEAWNGLFNSYPEGYVDMASMGLSNTSLQLVVTVKHGRVDGVIAEKKLCKVGFPHGYKLLSGDVGIFGNSADVQAFDHESGFPRKYANLNIRRKGIILEVTAKEGSQWLLPNPVRIAMHPTIDPDAGMKSLLDFCAEEHAELMNKVHKIRGSRKTDSEPSE